MRGFKRDNETTRLYGFKDRRSFVSLPKVMPHTNGVELSHIIAYGVDVIPIREECLKRSAIKNGEPRCKKCGVRVSDFVSETHPLRAEMHHIFHKPGERCWCQANLEILCHRTHAEQHANRRPWAK